MIVSCALRNKIKVTNIPWTVSRHELSLYFSQFGSLIETYVAFDKITGLNQGHGYVKFLKVQDMNTVLKQKHFLEGKNLIVNYIINK